MSVKTLYKYARAVLRFVLIIANNVYCIPTHVLWLWLLTPLRRYAPTAYYTIEGHLFSWLLAMVSLWSWSAGYDIVELGDDISRCLGKRTLVISNHQSTADVPMLMAAFNAKRGVLNEIMWIMDRIFKYTNFGVVSSYHRDFFIASGKDRREESIRRLKTHLDRSYIPLRRKWIMLFPEGGFLTKRKPISMRFAAKNNLPTLNHVTLPRMGAFFVIRDTLLTATGGGGGKEKLLNGKNGALTSLINHNNNITNNVNHNDEGKGDGKDVKFAEGEFRSEGREVAPELEYVLDITVAYPEGKPLNLQNIITGWREPCQTVLYYRLYSTKELPRDDAGLTQWTYDRFYEKEAMLDNYYRTKSFVMPDPLMSASEPNKRNLLAEMQERMHSGAGVLQQDLLRFAILHLFFLTSSYFHYQVVVTILRNCVALYSYAML